MDKLKATLMTTAVSVVALLGLAAPAYAFEAVEAPSVHVSEPAPSEHVSTPSEETSGSHVSEEPSETFSSHEDTDGVTNYHATYPFWVYASHPSTDCEQNNKNCPPTDPKQSAKYNQQKHHTAVVTGIVVGVVIVIGLAIAFAMVSSL